MTEFNPPAVEVESSAAMLAELDTLLERMLALPVQHVEEPAPAPPPQSQPQSEHGIPTPPAAVLETVAALEQEPPLPLQTTINDDLYLQTILSEHVTEEKPPQDQLLELPPSLPLRPPIAPPPPLPTMHVNAPDLPPLSMKPILWLNRGFDGLTRRLGPAGAWLRSGTGRTVLGWLGLLMLLAMGGLAVKDALAWPH